MSESPSPIVNSQSAIEKWLEVALTVNGELAEAVSEALRPFAHQAVVLEFDSPDPDAAPFEVGEPAPDASVRVRAFVALDGDAEQIQSEIEQALWPLRMIARASGLDLPDPTFAPVADRDWNAVWKTHYKPVRVGERLVIVPAWEQPALAPGDVPILVDPGQAFGTGMHPSTQLCLAAIERYVGPGARVLDVGCGSGILSIAAVKLGAARADGCDPDADAVAATRDNAQANGVSAHVFTSLGSFEQVGEKKYDLVVANILTNVLVKLLVDGLGATVAPDGKLVLSGILAEQAGAVREAVAAAGMQVRAEDHSGDWIALTAGW